MLVLRRHIPAYALLASCALGALLGSAACRAQPRDREVGAPAASLPAGSAPRAPEPNAEASRPKVVVLGDSLTAGLGLPENQAYPALLQKMIDRQGYRFEVENAGVSGDTSAGGLRRLDWALQGDVRVLIVALGGNDGLRGLPASELKGNLSTIIERARKRGVTVVLTGMEAPPNYGREYTVAFRQVYRDLAREYQAPFVPFLLDRVAGIPELNQADGIHPNARGAQIVADTVWRALKPVLDQITAVS